MGFKCSRQKRESPVGSPPERAWRRGASRGISAQYRNGRDTSFHATVGKMYPRQFWSYRKPMRNMRQ